MKFLFQLLGFALILFGVYQLGSNIIFTTNPSPYWWRGVSADLSVLSLTLGVAGFMMLPKSVRDFSWILVIFGIIFVVFSSTAILNPTTLWQFFLSVASMIGGFKLLTDRNLGG